MESSVCCVCDQTYQHEVGQYMTCIDTYCESRICAICWSNEYFGCPKHFTKCQMPQCTATFAGPSVADQVVVCTICDKKMCFDHHGHDYHRPFVCSDHMSRSGCDNHPAYDCTRMLVPEKKCLACDTFCCKHNLVLSVESMELMYACADHTRTCITCGMSRFTLEFTTVRSAGNQQELCNRCHRRWCKVLNQFGASRDMRDLILLMFVQMYG